MNKLIEYLLSIGFKITSNKDDFYTVLSKDGRKIIFGLSEHKKPPTLIRPRPIIEFKRFHKGNPKLTETICERFDDSVNYVLSNEPMERIYEAMFDKSIVFRYDLTSRIFTNKSI